MERLFIWLYATLLLIFMSSIVYSDFSDGLVLYLPLDEGTGDVAKDVSGNGHNGKIDNPNWVNGKFGKALQFDGTTTFITIESTDKLNVNEMAFMAWINAKHWDGTRQIVGKSVHGGCSGRAQYGLFSEGGNFTLRFETAGGRSNISAVLPIVGEWIHVTITNDGTQARIYYNGKEVGVGPVAGKLNTNGDPWRLGQDCDRENYIFAGIIDEARLWNRFLSIAEINEFMDLSAGDALTSVNLTDKLAGKWGKLKTKL